MYEYLFMPEEFPFAFTLPIFEKVKPSLLFITSKYKPFLSEAELQFKITLFSPSQPAEKSINSIGSGTVTDESTKGQNCVKPLAVTAPTPEVTAAALPVVAL